jgi:hypothetical protein
MTHDESLRGNAQRGDLTGDVIRARPTCKDWDWRERKEGWGLGRGGGRRRGDPGMSVCVAAHSGGT